MAMGKYYDVEHERLKKETIRVGISKRHMLMNGVRVTATCTGDRRKVETRIALSALSSLIRH